MFATLLLPLALSTMNPGPVDPAPAMDRTKLALDYASQYIEIGPATSHASFGGEDCVLVRPVGFGLCVFECGGVLALLDCDIEP